MCLRPRAWYTSRRLEMLVRLLITFESRCTEESPQAPRQMPPASYLMDCAAHWPFPTPPIPLSWILKRSLEPLWVSYRMHEIVLGPSHCICLCFYKKKMLGILNNWFANDWLAFIRQVSCRKWPQGISGLFSVIPPYVSMYILIGGYVNCCLLALLPTQFKTDN